MLSVKEAETLLLLGNRGPLTGYDFHSKLKEDGSGEKADTNIMSDPYWLKVRKKLLSYNFIVDFPEEGRRKPYRVGEDGFDYLIRNHIDEIQCFDVFAEYCGDHFPLVFGFWGELKSLGLDVYVKKNLKRIVGEIYLDIIKELALGERRSFSHNEFIESLYARLYLPELFIQEDEVPELIPFNLIREFRGERLEVFEFITEWIVDQEKSLYQKIKRLDQFKQSLP